MLNRLARWSYRRRWIMVALWIVALVGFIFLASTAGGEYSQNFSLPGSDSQEAYDLLSERFPEQAGETAEIVFQAEGGVADPAVQSTMEGLFGQLEEVRYVIGVDSPYAEGAQQISQDGSIAFATVHFQDLDGEAVPVPVADEIKELSAEAQTDAVTIEPGGSVIAFSEFEEPGGAEGIGLIAAMIILLITFGSVLAMGLPILMALFGISIGLSLVFLFANFLNVPDFTPQLAMMIGIGVGIDYALFIVTRYRQQLEHGLGPENATIVAIATAGKAVLFAGTTVVISLLGMLLMGFAFVEGVAVGGAAAVAVTMLASVTLLPATLGFVGRGIDRWRLPWFKGEKRAFESTLSYRWSRTIQRRPGRDDRHRIGRPDRPGHSRVPDRPGLRGRGLGIHRAKQPPRVRPLVRGLRAWIQWAAATRGGTREPRRHRCVGAGGSSARDNGRDRGRHAAVPERGRRRRSDDGVPDDLPAE